MTAPWADETFLVSLDLTKPLHVANTMPFFSELLINILHDAESLDPIRDRISS